MYDICFHAGPSESALKFALKLRLAMLKEGLNLQIFTVNSIEAQKISDPERQHVITYPSIYESVDISQSMLFAKAHGINNFASLYLTQKIFHDVSEKKMAEITSKKVQSVVKMLDFPKARIYMTFAGDEIDINMFRLYAKAQKGILVYSGITNIANRPFLTTNEKRFFDISTEPIEIPEQENNWIDTYINHTIQQKPILWGSPKETDVHFKVNYFYKLFRRLYTPDKQDTTNTTLFLVKAYISRLYNRTFTQLYYTKDYKKAIEKKFVYFPMHYPKDSQLTLRGLPFLKQADIIDVISRYLPSDYILLVKEHPHARGYSKVSDIKRISQLSRTFLLHPFVNSHDVLQKASGIVVINSSVGMEAMMYSKPVITLGRSFYRGQGLTIDVDSLYDLEQAFVELESFQVERQKLKELIFKIKHYSLDVDYKDLFKSKDEVIEKYANELSAWIKKNISTVHA